MLDYLVCCPGSPNYFLTSSLASHPGRLQLVEHVHVDVVLVEPPLVEALRGRPPLVGVGHQQVPHLDRRTNLVSLVMIQEGWWKGLFSLNSL